MSSRDEIQGEQIKGERARDEVINNFDQVGRKNARSKDCKLASEKREVGSSARRFVLIVAISGDDLPNIIGGRLATVSRLRGDILREKSSFARE